MALAQEPASSFRPRPVNETGGADPSFTPSPKSLAPPKVGSLPPVPTNTEPDLKRVQATAPKSLDSAESIRFVLRTEPPSADRLFGARETESQFEQRMKQAFADNARPEVAKFPEKPVLSKEQLKPRTFSQMTMRVEPAYVVHRRLFFEEKNVERYGWELGFLQPFVSAGAFYQDVFFFPKHILTQFRCWETNAGLCLPGDPIPFYWYPPEFFGNWPSIHVGIGIGSDASEWEINPTTGQPIMTYERVNGQVGP